MADASFRVAVVGAGRHAQINLYPAMIAAGYEIKAVAARHLDSAQVAASRYGCARAFDRVTEMLWEAGREVEAIVLVLPADGYEDVISDCLEAGLPIYCEKPVALDSRTMLRIEERRLRSNVTIMVGYMKRFAPSYSRARALVQHPGFGGVTGYNAYWGMGPGFGTLEYLMCENAVHQLDLARFLVGEVAEVAAWSHEAASESISASILMRFDGGAVGTVQVNSNSAWDHDNEWISVTGRGPVVVVDNVDTCMHRVPGESEQRWRPNYTLPIPENSSLTVTGFVGALAHFRDVVRGHGPCLSDLASALRTTELAEHVVAAIRRS